MADLEGHVSVITLQGGWHSVPWSLNYSLSGDAAVSFQSRMADIVALCVCVCVCVWASPLESGKGELFCRAYYPECTAARHIWHSGPRLMKCLVRLCVCVCVCVERASQWGTTSTFTNRWIVKCLKKKPWQRHKKDNHRHVRAGYWNNYFQPHSDQANCHFTLRINNIPALAQEQLDTTTLY